MFFAKKENRAERFSLSLCSVFFSVPMNPILFIFVLSCSLLSQLQRMNNGHNQYATEEIADTMNKIEGKPRNNPGDHSPKVQPKHQCLGWCIQDSEAKPMSRTYHHVNYRGCFWGHIPG